jgi:hypothetical protein
VEGVQPVDARLLHHLLGHRVRQQPGDLLGHLRPRRAVRLHADRVDHRVGTAPVGHRADHLGEVLVVLAQVEDLRATSAHALQPLAHQVHADHPVAAVHGDASGHVADRAKSEHRHAPAVRDAGVLHGLPGRWEHIGEVHEALVGRSVRELDVRVLRLGHAQVLCLPAVLAPVELRVAEEHGAHSLLADLGRLALGLEALVAHEAVATGDLERDYHAVAGRQLAHLCADLLHHAHRLVPQDRSLLDEWAEQLVEVQIGTADGGGGHPHDRIGRLLDSGIRHRVHANVAPSVVSESLHAAAHTRLESAHAGRPRSHVA